MSQLKILFWFVEYPWVIGLIIPIIIALVLLVRWNANKERRFARLPIIISRTIIFALLLIALASPYTNKQTVIEGDPFVKILVDNSTSFNLFDRQEANKLVETLKPLIEVETKTIGFEERSALGDDVLGNLEKDESILLVTDGNANYGSSLGDVALHAARLNSTINVIKMQPIKSDSSIRIIGPDKIIEGTDNAFRVKIENSKPDMGHHVIVMLDGQAIYDQVTKDEVIEFTQQFTSGYHTFEASISTEDFEPRNNIFYKIVKVIKKPKVLLYSEKDSKLGVMMNKIYEVTTVADLDGLNDDYQALVIDDMPADRIDPYVNQIRDFVSDGNGLYVVGGKNSFEYGNYKESLVQGILPIDVGSAEQKDEKVNIVIAIDISKSVDDTYGAGSAQDVEKALALTTIDNLNDGSQVGIIAFNTRPYVVSELLPLAGRRDELAGKIKSLINVGGTHIPAGLARGIQMLETAPGGKNLIIISDGKSGGVGESQSLAAEAADKGIKVYTISVGYDDIKTEKEIMFYGDSLLRAIAKAGNGIWIQGDEAPQKVKILFGDHTGSVLRDSFQAVILDEDHFITEGLEISAIATGFNQVIPKSSSRVLVTLDSGEPLITVWRFGLGRVAVLSTDSGEEWSNDFYSQDSSIMLTRSLNWVIGDPERGSREYINIMDTRVNETTEIIVKSPTPPQDEDMVFYKIGDDLYSATIPANELGFHDRFGARYAVNYKSEYEMVKFNEELETIAFNTGGKVFEPDDINGMINELRSQSKRVIEKKTYLRWPFIIAALMLFLIEVCLRRIAENRRR